jgi:hypothetical protein
VKTTQRSVAWRVVAIILLIAGFSFIATHFTSEVESGVVMKLDQRQVCISREVLGGRNVGCWRVDENTDIGAGVTRGDLVTVRHRGDLALSVTE